MHTKLSNATLEQFTTFGDFLQFLRRRAGLTQLELSIAVGYSSSQISRLEQNLRLPDPPVIQARFVPALLLEDEPLAAARLLELAETVRKEDAPARGLCPYKGLDYFDEPDADIFIGREVLTEKLTQRMLSLAVDTKPDLCRLLAIVGASGSGKSSLVRAGLVPALRWNKTSANWPIHMLTPGAHPLESLTTELVREKGSITDIEVLMDELRRDQRSLYLFIKREFQSIGASFMLLVIDQFEELFTLCHSEEERSIFIDNLITAVSVNPGVVAISIALRADFYAHCAGYFELRQALADHQEYIGAMDDPEMRRAIEEPASRGHWEFEPGLVDLILHDVGHEPGSLPLLSHALFETWQRRHGRLMTLSGYTSAGGVRGAIAETAEAVFTDQFNPQQQAIARRIFLRLTELGDTTSTGDTRRKAALNELVLCPEDTEATQAVLKVLADARLVTITEDSVQVAHEALIREWPTLRSWLEENRESLRLHRHLTESAEDWQAAGREPGMLLRGARLVQAREWAASHSNDMNEQEREFVTASFESLEKEAAEQEAQRQRELAAAQKLAETELRRAEEGARFAHRLRRRAILVSVMGCLAVLLAMFSIFAWQRSASAAAINQSISLARAAEQANASGRGDLALVLAKQAVDINQQSPEVLQAIRKVAFNPGTRAILSGHTQAVSAVAISPDAKIAISGSCAKLDSTGVCGVGELILWDLESYQILDRWSAHSGWVTAVAFSPDGKSLISGGDDGRLILWNLDGEEIHEFTGHTSAITDLAVIKSINGLLSSSSDGSLILWGINSAVILQKYESTAIPITSIAVSSGSLMALTAQKDGNLTLWNLLRPQPINTYKFMGADIISVAISPDGGWFLYTSNALPEIYIRKIDSRSGNVLNQHNFDCSPGHIAVSPDIANVFVTCQSAIFKLSSSDLEKQQVFLDSPEFIDAIAISQDGLLALSGSEDGTLRLWNLGMQLQYDVVDIKVDVLRDFDITSDGKYLVFNDSAEDGKEQPGKYELSSGRAWKLNAGLFSTSSISRILLSPDNAYIAIAGLFAAQKNPKLNSPAVMVWDDSASELLCRFDNLYAPGRAIAFSPDGLNLLVGTQDQENKSGQLILLEAKTCEQVRQFASTEAVTSIAFNADGSRAITGMSFNGRVILWDVATGQQIRSYPYSNYGPTLPVAFSPDGSQILSASPADLFLVDIATRAITRSYSGLEESPTSISISRDGRYVVSGGRDGNIILWDYDTGEVLHRINLHQAVIQVKFSSDSSIVYAITDAQKLIKWTVAELSLPDLLRWISANRYVRELTCFEKLQYQLVSRCDQ